MSQGKTSARSLKSGYESSSQHSSYTSGDTYSDTYSTYGLGSEPDYIMLEIRIKQQADDIGHLQKHRGRLAEDLDLERAQGMHRLRKLDAAAKAAEKRIQELSVELERSQETVQHYQHLYDMQAGQIQELAACRETQEDRRAAETRIHQLEDEIAQAKEEIKNGNYESTQQRATIRKAQEEKCISQRLLEASEKERRDLEKKLADLERQNRRQESALSGAAQGWLKKNHEIAVQQEEIRWKMVDSKSGIVLGSHHRRPRDAAASAGVGGGKSAKGAAASTTTTSMPKSRTVAKAGSSASSKGHR